ncbi:hypothetical protein JHD48_01705 [Sulfurimonas sp. SAG-AH-194-I05]|nr:polysialyltransferase family glycosyltransferase [Sulfurimonas sp. SAG-AH-194-I05]MDF1874443.1 hypothetical protein [Sulfurimonas sp. SAG-AH-194-I05]
MKKDNLFVIGTPLQLINAIEAIEHFHLKNNILVLINMSKMLNKEQVDEIRTLHEWKEVIEIQNGKGLNFFKYFSILRKLRKNSYQKLFVAKLESISMAIVANMEKEQVFLLDDGGMTVGIYENYCKNNYRVGYKRKDYRFYMLGLKFKIEDTIHLFTYYDLEEHNNQVVKNTMKYFKTKYYTSQFIEDECIYFVGQPVNNLLSEEVHVAIIKKLIEKKEKKMVYIPHRGESENHLKHLRSLPKDIFEIKSVGMPIELYFLKNAIQPKYIFSFFSTALVTLKLIYNTCEVKYIKIPETLENKDNFTLALKNYYEHLDAKDILSLKNLGL